MKRRLLVNFDDGNANYTDVLGGKDVEIDGRLITQIGTENSADSLAEYDAILLSYKNPMNFIQDRIHQILNFLGQENKLFIYILHKQVLAGPNYSNTNYLEAIIDSLGGRGSNFIYADPSGSNFTISEKAKKIGKYPLEI